MKAFVLSLIFLSNALMAGWRDCNELTPSIGNLETRITLPKLKKFHCPDHCGEWGSESLQKIEWKFMGLMFQADIISTFLARNGEAYTYDDRLDEKCSVKFDFPYAKPQDTDSVWYKEMARCAAQEGVVGRLTISDQSEGRDCGPYVSYSDAPYECWGSLIHFWGIKPIYNEEKCLLGHIFTREDFRSVYFDEEDECCCWYDNAQKVHYQFDNYVDFKQACLDLHQEINWLREEVYLAHCSSKLKEASNAQYQEFKILLHALEDHYASIFTSCAGKHQAPSAFYNIALQNFETGDHMRALEQLDKVFERIELDVLEKFQASKVCFTQGAVASQVALYDAAIQNLNHAIQKDPNNKEAYLERALAYFEIGDFEKSLESFSKMDQPVTPLDFGDTLTLEFASGLIKGTLSGASSNLVDFIPSMLSSVRGLSFGLWAFASDPIEVSRELIFASQRVIEFIQTNDILDLFQVVIPEVKELRNQELSAEKKGELFGQILGRFGTDFFLFAGASKGMKLYKDLRHANATLALEKMTKDLAKKEVLTKISNNWWEKTSSVIKGIKKNEGKYFDQKLYKAFKNEHLSELQVRKILHHCGYKTFPRPKGIPSNSTVQISKKNGGMIYVKAGTIEKQNILIRIMPGDPTSPHPMQQKPYVIQRRNKEYFTLNGWIDKPGSEAHIPLENFEFKGW